MKRQNCALLSVGSGPRADLLPEVSGMPGIRHEGLDISKKAFSLKRPFSSSPSPSLEEPAAWALSSSSVSPTSTTPFRISKSSSCTGSSCKSGSLAYPTAAMATSRARWRSSVETFLRARCRPDTGPMVSQENGGRQRLDGPDGGLDACTSRNVDYVTPHEKFAIPRKSEADLAITVANSLKLITPSPSTSASLIISVNSLYVNGWPILAMAPASSAAVMYPLPSRSNDRKTSMSWSWLTKISSLR
ncbi:hypothetical protein F8388_019536 [Cannabis sativa]|uniref:Uncharacterized protein n=1 Tax=Cannabis sativa TaxID=3483 RepID=A0A7J6DZX7_CANSA|nr:hypothetical protein F8388_019536 [Cannabis sativa]